jgi:ABC-type multidrug transport system fused ATPase/permease subunit
LSTCDAGSTAPTATQTILVTIFGIGIVLGIFFFYHLRRINGERKERLEAEERNKGREIDLTKDKIANFINMEIRFEGLGLTLENGTTILNNVNGFFEGSSLTAIMGPSGCGKSVRLSSPFTSQRTHLFRRP